MEEKVIICGVVKNVAKLIEKNIQWAKETAKMFTTSKIIVYENNSTDETKEILKRQDGITVISEDFSPETIRKESKIWAYTKVTGSDHPCRIEQIVNARNRLIDIINQENDYDYVIWIDLDSDGWSLEGIFDSFQKKLMWDVLYANGLTSDGNYYDMYAYRNWDFLYGPEILGELFWQRSFYKQPRFQGDYLIPIISGYGGIQIIKKELFKNHRFDSLVNDSVKEFYSKIQLTQNDLHVIQNPCPKFPGGYYENGIHWKPNCGYDNTVVSEYVAFNIELWNEEYKIVVNPKLIYKHL